MLMKHIWSIQKPLTNVIMVSTYKIRKMGILDKHGNMDIQFLNKLMF